MTRSRVSLLVAALAMVGLGACAEEPTRPEKTLQLLVWTQIQPGFTSRMVSRLNEAIPNVRIVPEATHGSFFVVSALDNREGELGYAQADVVYLAYRDGTKSRPQPHTNLRAISVLWINSVYVLARSDSGIRSISDLRGKRVGMMLPGSSGELMSRLTLGAHGLSYEDLEPQFYAVDDLAEPFRNGTIEAAVATGATLAASLAELSRSGLVRLLSIDRDVSMKLRESYPFLKMVTIPARELPGREADLETVGADGVLICHKDLDEPLVHALTKTFFEQLPELNDEPVAAMIDPERAPATPIPLHPGAARYYREREILP